MNQEAKRELPTIRPPLELIAFAAWVNVDPDKIPATMQGPTCRHTMEAWKRVADALMEEAARVADTHHGGLRGIGPVGRSQINTARRISEEIRALAKPSEDASPLPIANPIQLDGSEFQGGGDG